MEEAQDIKSTDIIHTPQISENNLPGGNDPEGPRLKMFKNRLRLQFQERICFKNSKKTKKRVYIIEQGNRQGVCSNRG